MISWTRSLHPRRAALLGAPLVLVVFLFDLTQPLGVSGGMPYVALPLLGLLARSSRSVIALAVVGTVFTVVGMLLSAPGAPPAIALINRGMSTVFIWIVATIVIRHLVIGARLRQSLVQQAARDPLTGLYNRRHVFNVVRNELRRFRRYGDRLSLILIDADHFKAVNDLHGHCGGDAALKLIAGICNRSVRETDVVGRFGGEEFIVLLPHTGRSEALIVAERIRDTMRRTALHWEGRTVRVTLSLGVAEAGPDADSFDQLLRSADRALYAAKRGGRNRVAYVRPTVRTTPTEAERPAQARWRATGAASPRPGVAA